MKRSFYLLILLMVVSSCHHKQVINNSQFDKEFYSIINNIIQYRLTGIGVIVDETMPIYRNIYGNYNNSLKSEVSPPPPPPNVISYDKYSFNAYITRHYVDSVDAAFMYESIDSMKVIKLDSSQLVIPVISTKKLHEILNTTDPYNGYDMLYKLYGKRCYIAVSTPVFNSDFTKVIISIDHLCGPLWGQGYEFILEKRNGKWWLVYDGGTWVS